MTAELEIQRAVLSLVLREHPAVLALPTLADLVLANPRSLTGGVALARALRVLDDEGLVFSDGRLVQPAGRRSISGASWEEVSENAQKRLKHDAHNRP